MREKLAELTQKIAHFAHIDTEHWADTTVVDKADGLHSNDFNWMTSFLGSDRSTPPAQSKMWERAKHARLETNHTNLRKLPLGIQTAAVVGREIWAARQIAPGKAMQIVSGSKLIAVLSVASPIVSIRTDVLVEDLEFMTALVRPKLASGTPEGFINHDLWNVLWQYGQYDATAMLEMPSGVSWRELQLRRLPHVSPYLLQSRHASILRHLLDGDRSFKQLVELTGESPDVLCHDITAMMLTRAVRCA